MKDIVVSKRTKEIIDIIQKFHEVHQDYQDWLKEEYDSQEISDKAFNDFVTFISSVEKHLSRRIIGVLSETKYFEM